MKVTKVVTSRSPSTHRVSRRAFLEGSVAVAAAAIPGGAFAAGSDSIRIGLVGCGGRGVGAAVQAVAAHPGVVIAAVGDLFADQLDAARATLSATCGNRFSPRGLFHGAQAAELVIASEVDAVILATPPCFRPAEIAAAVRAGRHVYAEAPVGVDAMGVRFAAAAADDGIRRRLSLASGLQSRHHAPLRSTVAAVASGRIGRPLRAVAIHHVGLPWVRPLQPGWSAEDAAVRNWIGVDRLSGGGFLQHLVHAIDRCSWALGEPTPLSATAIPEAIALPQPLHRGIEAAVRIAFVDGTSLEAGIVRREGIEDHVAEAIQGSHGTADLRRCTVAKDAALASPTGEASGHAACMAAFIDSLRSKPPRTDLAAACRSTMLAVMARSAATDGGTVSWHDLWRPSSAPLPSGPVQSSMV